MLFNTILSLINLPLSFMSMITLLVITAAFYRYKQRTKQDHQQIKSMTIAKIVAYSLVFASLLLIWQNLEVPSLIAISAVLTVLSWAKACELKTNRDSAFIWLLSTVLLAIQLLILIQYQSLIAIIGLLLILSSASSLWQMNSQKLLCKTNKVVISQIGVLLVISLPFALLLFITLPRINLPMQELGLAMGLPISVKPEKNLAAKGLGKELGFDEIGEQGQSDSRVLVASLPSDFVQNSEQPLYWRGPVYWRYSVIGTGEKSEEKWQLREGFTNRSKRQYNGFGSNKAVNSMASMREKYEEKMRSIAAGFLLHGPIMKNKVGSLSEGQKGLLAFAKLTMEEPGLLILDEPTNHINFRHIPVIAEALNSYKGAMILVSHVEDFVEQIKIDETLDLAKLKPVKK